MAARRPVQTSIVSIIALFYCIRLAYAQTTCAAHQGDGGDDSEKDGGNSHSSRTSSFCGSSTATGTSAGSSGTSISAPAIGTSAGDGSLRAANTDHIGGGGIAGIVVGILAFIVLVMLLGWFLRRRYANSRERGDKLLPQHVSEASSASNVARAVGGGAAGVGDNKEAVQRHADDPPLRSLPNPHVDVLPPLPSNVYDPTSPTMRERDATILTYTPPPRSTSDNASSLAHSQSLVSQPTISTGPPTRHMSLHEDLVASQKELETNYRLMERGEGEEGSGAGPSEPPPRYME